MGAMMVASSWIVHAPEWFGVVVLAAIAWVVYRGGGGSALEVLRTSNRVLDDELRELKRLRVVDARKIAALEARTDLTVALEPLRRALDLHEQHASERNSAQLHVLEMIAAKLGPDEPAG